jgi:pyruvate formate lyase activating enzyme
VLHFSRYFPHYRYDAPPTPVAALERAHRIARERLDYVYLGNVAGTQAQNNTSCPGCGNLLVERHRYAVRVKGIADGKCRKCGRTAAFRL